LLEILAVFPCVPTALPTALFCSGGSKKSQVIDAGISLYFLPFFWLLTPPQWLHRQSFHFSSAVPGAILWIGSLCRNV